MMWPDDLLQDIELIDLDDFRHGNANITAFRLVDPGKKEVVELQRDMEANGDVSLEQHGGLRVS